jgi:DNA-directed RNA polymerase sigma subunit (sigma70/sigma32)
MFDGESRRSVLHVRGLVDQAIANALAQQARTIRLPVHVERLFGRSARELERFSQALGRWRATRGLGRGGAA